MVEQPHARCSGDRADQLVDDLLPPSFADVRNRFNNGHRKTIIPTILMTDPSRSDRHATGAEASERDRDARIEELLVEGLDHYFSERYELAINVWTRVLFIDRGHARARAYIERARSAAAERQRKGDELLHTGAAAFDRGDADAARQLIASAVEHGASRDEALALLARIERLETAAAHSWLPAPPPSRTAVPSHDQTAAAHSARLKWIAAG